MKKFKPTTASRRQMTTVTYNGLTPAEPQKSLTKGFKRSKGRGGGGRITTRHKGGGHKRRYREIDFFMRKKNIPFKITSIEYDPNRSGFIGLSVYEDGEKHYTLLPEGVALGEKLVISEAAPLKIGNRLPLSNLPVGTFVYNVEIKPGGGAKLVRSAGSFAEVVAKDAGYVDLKLPSGEIRKIKENAWASVGEVSNKEQKLVNLGKAGRSRWLGIRPTVRGSAMNPVDHPYGGGEGRAGRGIRRAKSRWGKPTGKGQKTRRAKKYSNIFIVSRRKSKKGKKTLK
jgi:large subunit ribosomal protein L2